MDKLSYSWGLAIGNQLSQMGVASLDYNDFLSGIKCVFEGNSPLISYEYAQKLINEYLGGLQKETERKMRAAGDKFLSENKAKAGVKETASGLQYIIEKEGDGVQPLATDEVTVHYIGKFVDGTVFDSSVSRGEPATFPLNQVIKGWTEGVQLMKEGSKYVFFIPSDLAYGSQGVPNAIPPHSTLIFEIELIKVNKK